MNEQEVRALFWQEMGIDASKMVSEEKVANANNSRDAAHDKTMFAEEQSADVAREFIKLEVQIATILFVFVGVFVNSFIAKGQLDLFWTKLALSFAILSLILSLVMGLIHLKEEEAFWDRLLSQRFLRYLEWKKVTEKKTSFEEATAFHEGTALGRGNIISAPQWTWVLQTIFLGASVFTLFVLFLIFIFSN